MSPTATTDQIEFARTIDGLFMKGLGPLVDASLKAKLKPLGLDLDKPLLPGYPAADFHKWVQITAKHIHPGLPIEECARILGQAAVPGLEDSMIGRAVASGLKLIGPRRSLERIERIFRNNNNYQKVVVMSVNESGGKVSLGDVFGLPTYYQGIFEKGLPMVGARNPRVTLVPAPPPGAYYDLIWDS